MSDQRQQATRRLANIMRLARVTYETARMELLGALSDQQAQVYDVVRERGETVAADVVAALGVEINHASGLLKGLAELHLLEREPVIDDVGKRYVYRVK